MTDDPISLAYQQYSSDPTPDNLSVVVNALTPTINYNLRSRGLDKDPLFRNKAKLFTAEAIKKYDPSYKANLSTFVNSNLQQLNRAKRKASQVVAVSDRTQLDKYALEQARIRFEDKHGREPDLNELADESGFPKTKIEKLRNTDIAQVSDSALENSPTNIVPTWTQEAMDYVYDDTDYLNRKIMEYKFGYRGSPTIQENYEIANKLKIHPSQIGRRLFRITKKIEELEQALKQINM